MNWLRGFLGLPTRGRHEAVIKQVVALQLQRGDVLVVRFDSDVDSGQASEVQRIFSHLMPGVGLIVMAHDTEVSFEAVRPAPPDKRVGV